MGQIVIQVRQSYRRWTQNQRWNHDDRLAVERRLQRVSRGNTPPRGDYVVPRWALRNDRAFAPVAVASVA